MRRSRQVFKALFFMLAIFFLLESSMEYINAYGQPRWKIPPQKEKGRDPFLLPPSVRLISPGGEEKPFKKEAKREDRPSSQVVESSMGQLKEPSLPTLSLKAILISDYIRLAAIDQEIVGEGGLIAGERVLEIHPDRVILGKGERRRTLYLPQSSVPLKVEEK